MKKGSKQKIARRRGQAIDITGSTCSFGSWTRPIPPGNALRYFDGFEKKAIPAGRDLAICVVLRLVVIAAQAKWAT